MTKSNALVVIYHRLFDHYGPQHWWPGETPFEVMVGAILTQSAAWQNVEKAINNLKTAGILTPVALRKLPVEEIARLIHPSGYFNAKAVKLKAMVDWLYEICDDDLEQLFDMNTSDLRRQLLAVHGIGPETADSILLYAADKPIFVIDTYTRRILTRLGLAPEKNDYDSYQLLFMQSLPAETRFFNEYHALLVRLGKTVCRKKPVCQGCCLFDMCSLNRAI